MLPLWADLPQLIDAPSPYDKSTVCRLRTASFDALKGARAGRRDPMMTYWSIIMGMTPPGVALREDDIELATPNNFISINDAHACFQGLRRPVADDQSGQTMVAYILKPRLAYGYHYVSAEAGIYIVPRNVVFAAYARLDWPIELRPTAIAGVLTHWEFVPADQTDTMLPDDWADRYDTRRW
jgi:hypothetical protein